jgi:hypothetical protein
MKTFAKVGVGCLVVLILCCLIGIVAVVYSGKKVTDLLGGIGGAKQMAKDIKAMEQLEKDFPFTPPESGDVEEPRLQAYIAVATGVKTAMAPYESWIKTHEGKHDKGDWKDVKKALSMTAELVAAMHKGLFEQQMNSKEFHWIEQSMRTASRESGGAQATDAQREMVGSSIKVLEEQMGAPGATPESKAQIQEQIDKLKATLEEAGGPVSANRALYLRYEKELQACDLAEFGNIKLGD